MHEFFNEEAAEEQDDLLDLNEVMRAFGIDEWTNLGAVESSHAESLSLLVETQGQWYVLHERSEGLMGEDPQHRYAFQHYLREAGIPVPALRPNPQGESVVTLGEDFFELQEWVAGEHFSTTDRRSLKWVESAGTMLGRIHQASRHYKGHQHAWPVEAQIGAVVQSYLNLARSKADEMSVLAVASALANWADQWEAVLPAAMMSIGSNKNVLPEFHIHGDYHALNLRFDDAGITAVMGMEATRWEKRIFEVAYGLFYFSALQWNPAKVSRDLW